MEKLLTINNGESNWEKLGTFGLHARRGFIGFNRYLGKNSAVSLVDNVTGMRVMLIPASQPRTERTTKADKVPGKRGRPAKVGCIMLRSPQKRGRKPLTPEQLAEREAIKAELAGLVFYNYPMRKRGPKPLTDEQRAERAATGQSGVTTGKKRGRKSEADRLKEAKAGDIVEGKGGYWTILACGVATWTSQAA